MNSNLSAIGNDMVNVYALWMAKAQLRKNLASESLRNGADPDAMQVEIEAADAAIKHIHDTICGSNDPGIPGKAGYKLVEARAAAMYAQVRSDVLSGKTRL